MMKMTTKATTMMMMTATTTMTTMMTMTTKATMMTMTATTTMTTKTTTMIMTAMTTMMTTMTTMMTLTAMLIMTMLIIQLYALFSDSYVKLNLVRGSKILTTKKTRMIRKNLEPKFEEEFVFEVAEDLLDQVNLVFHVKDKSLIGRKRLIGELCVGCQGVGQGLAQWQLMVDKEVVMWHQLELLNIVPGKTDLQTTMASLQGWDTTSEEESEEEEGGMFTGLLPGGLFPASGSKSPPKKKKSKVSKREAKL